MVFWLTAIVALCLVIIIHEFGHYVAAIATGMKVDRFSVFGIGPVVLRLGHWRGTEFVISAIPFGAYVMIRGMEPVDDDERPAQQAPTGSEHFRDKPLLSRFFVLFGGPFANYLAAALIYFGVFAGSGIVTGHHMVIAEFADGSTAQLAGLREGDRFVAMAGETIDASRAREQVPALSAAHRGEAIDVTVDRGGELVTRTIVLSPDIGLGVAVLRDVPIRREVSVGAAAAAAIERPYVLSVTQLSALYRWATGQLEADMTGPVGIAKFIKRSAEAGLVPFLSTVALISTLLGLFNLLPIPALDGGRIAFLAYEAVAPKPASSRIEGWVHGVGMIALLLLIAIITISDIRGS